MREKLDNEHFEELQEAAGDLISVLEGLRSRLEELRGLYQSDNPDKVAEELNKLNELIYSAKMLQQAPRESGHQLLADSFLALVLQVRGRFSK